MHKDVDEDIPMGNASDLACMNQQILANPSDGFLAKNPRSGRITLKLNGPKEKGVSTTSPKHEYSDKHTPMKNTPDLPREIIQKQIGNISKEAFANAKSGRRIRLKINGPKEKGGPTSHLEHDYPGEYTPTGNAPNLPHVTVQQKSVNNSNEFITNTPKSSRKRRRARQFGSRTRAIRRRCAFADTSTYYGASRRSKILDVSLTSPTKQPSLNQYRKPLIPTLRISNAAGGGSSASASQPSADVNTSSDRGCSNQSGSVEPQSGPEQPVESQSRPLGEDSDSENEGGNKNRKRALKNCHDVSDVSSDDSKKRKTRASIKKGKRALEQVDPNAWLLGVPSPFPTNEINCIRVQAKAKAPAVICSFGTSSQQVGDSDSASDAARGSTNGSPSVAASGVASGAAYSAARGSINGCTSNIPTTEPLHMIAAAPDRSLTPRDISFPGPPRKQLRNKVSNTCDGVDSSCIDEPQERYEADRERSPSRGRVASFRSLNVSRDESEERPGWRNTVLVPAHVITGEETRDRPWVLNARPHVLEMTGRDREEGYKASSLSTDCSSNIDSTSIGEDSSLGYGTEEMRDAPPPVHATEERSDVPPLIQGTEPTADILLVQAAIPLENAQQLEEDIEPVSDIEDLVDGSSSRGDPMPTSEADGASATSPEEIAEDPARRQCAPSLQMVHGRTMFHLPHTSSVPGSVSMTFPPGVEAWGTLNNLRLRQASSSSIESCADCDCCVIEAFKCIVCGFPQRQIQTFRSPRHPPPQSATAEQLRSQTVSQEADRLKNPTRATTANATPDNRSNEASTETLDLQEFEVLTSGQPGDCNPSQAQKAMSPSRQVSF